MIRRISRLYSSGAMEFPCLDKIQLRQKQLENGPEPDYENIVSGFSTSTYSEPFKLIHGGVLPSFTLAYETWGKLAPDKSNVILIHTGLSGSSHAKSQPLNMKPGWWEKFIGPGLAIDTATYHVICTNVLGGCYGSTGPSSIDPQNEDKERYATSFPIVTIFDMVRAQFLMLDSMGIDKIHASVGCSMGGMQALAAAAMYPSRVSKMISISAAARSHPYSIALRYAQRQVLMADPNWAKGKYYKGVLPHSGMKLARQIATITYRSGPEWEERFGRVRADPDLQPSFCADYLIETYLDHQGERFCLTYDPNSLLYVSKAMDMFDMSHPIPCVDSTGDSQEQDLESTALDQRQRLVRGLSNIQMPSLILGVQSDLLFPIWQQKEIADSLKEAGNTKVTYYELDAKYGHDTFLIDVNTVGGAIKGHLETTL